MEYDAFLKESIKLCVKLRFAVVYGSGIAVVEEQQRTIND